MPLRIERVLDDIGWQLLAALQEDARLSFTELGRRVGLSAPAVAERVHRLEDAGVIRGYRLELGLEALGLSLTALIRLQAPEEKCPALKAFVAGLPEVLECHHVTGTDAFVLKVVASSVGHLEAVIEALGRWGTPATSIILSSPVARRSVTEPRLWTLRRSRRRVDSRPPSSSRQRTRTSRA
jgi:Lrp/AsnC family transcriptional regulator, leucine-responsive regulatory protein